MTPWCVICVLSGSRFWWTMIIKPLWWCSRSDWLCTQCEMRHLLKTILLQCYQLWWTSSAPPSILSDKHTYRHTHTCTYGLTRTIITLLRATNTIVCVAPNDIRWNEPCTVAAALIGRLYMLLWTWPINMENRKSKMNLLMWINVSHIIN